MKKLFTKEVKIALAVLISAAISGLVGQKLLKKHFEKAGVV